MCNEVQSNDVVPLLLTTRSSKVANEETSFVAREPSIMPFSFISRDLQEDTHGYDSDPCLKSLLVMIYLCIIINNNLLPYYLVNKCCCFLWINISFNQGKRSWSTIVHVYSYSILLISYLHMKRNFLICIII